MEYRSSEIRAGFFIFLGFLGLVATIFTLGDLKNLLKPKKDVQIFFRFAGGLELGAPVSYAGLQIGRVKHIELLGSHGEPGKDQISVVAEIDPSIHLKKDSRVTIKTSGLMGGVYVDIRPGSTVSKPLMPDEHLEGHESFEIAQVGDMMTEVVMEVRRFTDLSENLVLETKKTLKSVQGSMALVHQSLKDVPDIIGENRNTLRINMNNLQQLSYQLNQLVNENKEDLGVGVSRFASVMEKSDKLLTDKGNYIGNIIDQVNHLSRDLGLLLADTRPELTSLVRNMDSGAQQITASIDTVSGKLDKTLHQGNEVILENRRNLLHLIKNLKTTSENLKTLSGDLKRNPWKLVRKSDEQPMPVVDTKNALPLRNELRMKRLDKISDKD